MDIEILLTLQNFREGTGNLFTNFLNFITEVGGSAVIFLIMGALYWCVDKEVGSFAAVSYYTGTFVNNILKNIFCVYRPWMRDARITPDAEALGDVGGPSFPSGHSAHAVSFFGGIAAGKGISKLLRVLLIVLIALIGFSRLYLGVHTPQDVLVSFAVSTLIIVAMKFVSKWLAKNPNLDLWIMLIALVFCVAYPIFAYLKGYPTGTDENGNLLISGAKESLQSLKASGEMAGMIIGWFVERRFIRFSVEGTVQGKFARYLLCICGYLVISMVLCPLLGKVIPMEVGRVVSGFLPAFYIMAIAPLFIKLAAGRKAA